MPRTCNKFYDALKQAAARRNEERHATLLARRFVACCQPRLRDGVDGGVDLVDWYGLNPRLVLRRGAKVDAVLLRHGADGRPDGEQPHALVRVRGT